ncbi:lantibiotic dehydratase [Streptomyces sp. NPDC017673]|uniref:lantibiotic dehydratase n=1 Tax=unclassified Streptomyces TaxID=2593676 RepID=UPI0037BB9D8D
MKATSGTGRAAAGLWRAGPVLLRAAVPRSLRPQEADEQTASDDTGFLRAVAHDAFLREALLLSSSSLSATLDKVEAGQPVPARKLRRAVRAITRYRLRLAGRSTPFGILAGVAAGGFGPEPEVRWGRAHRKSVYPDAGWLTDVLTELEGDLGVLRMLHVTTSDLCWARGGRLVVPHAPAGDSRGVRQVSLRHTAAVRAALTEAARPVAFTHLEKTLAVQFPAVTEAVVANLLRQLVAVGALLTDLRPSSATRDPLGHVLGSLSGTLDEATAASRHTLAELAAVRRGLAEYAGTPLGRGRSVLGPVTARMDALRACAQPVQVDLGLDVRVTLPPAVATEVERAAEVLTRMAARRPGPDFLAAYHADFLERYGTQRAVPLLELLDPDRGLGAPAGYRHPGGAARKPVSRPLVPDGIDALLIALAQETCLLCEDEIVLDDTLVRALCGEAGSADGGSRTGSTLQSFDLLTHLLADSTACLARGDFQLVVLGVRTQAGAYAGRFAHLLPTGPDGHTQLLRDLPVRQPSAVRAQLVFAPLQPRAANVARTAYWGATRIEAGTFADRGSEHVLGLHDIAVVATPRRLAAVALSTGCEIVPTLAGMVATDAHAPNAVRLLNDIVRSGDTAAPGWRWGTAEALPYLPRVRYGRTVLSTARWRPVDPSLHDTTSSDEQWAADFRRWRTRWRLPDRVRVADSDRRITLDLDSPAHLALLRGELRRRPSVVLEELPAGGSTGCGWLAPADGGAAEANGVAEVVFSLVRQPGAAPAGTVPSLPGPLESRDLPKTPHAPSGTPGARRNALPSPDPAVPFLYLPGRTVHPPGSEWLYAKVYCAAERHDEILAERLPELLAELPPEVDRWFYVRYRDDSPHLRLRFHGDPGALTGRLLPRITAWTRGLSGTGTPQRLVLDTYDPEAERYGGAGALPAAEAFFEADSRTCLEEIRLLRRPPADIDPLIVMAADYINLAHRMLGPDRGHRWLIDRASTESPAVAGRDAAAPGARAEKVLDPADDWSALRSTPWGEHLTGLWAERGDALEDFTNRLRAGRTADEATTADTVLASVLHMHHNRLHGIDRAHEKQALALAARACRAAAARSRAVTVGDRLA